MTTLNAMQNLLRRVACLTLLAVSCMGLSGPVCAEGTSDHALPTIEYASPDQSVWTTKTKENGEPDNPLNQVAAALFGKAGIPWKARSYPASRMFVYLQDGTVQFSMLVRAPALQDCCLFSKLPITTALIRVYRHAGTLPVKTKEDLVGKQVITVRGYSYGGLASFLADEHNHVTTHDTQNHSSAFRMLANGRAEYLIDYAGPASEVLASEPIEGIAFDVLTRQDVYMVLSKTYPDAQAVMQKLESIASTLDVGAILGHYAEQTKRALQPQNPGSKK